jgi:RNA polymerase sigma-70 factor (ECF subfamily)
MGQAFVTTRWSQVLAVGGGDGPARAALAWLCERYWDPLHAHVRRCGFAPEDAADLTQDFLLAVVRGGVVERADRNRGRFRTFLLACLTHHLAHARERSAAAKRGGGVSHATVDQAAEQVAIEADPARGFDRDWAVALLARARDRLAAAVKPQRHGLLRFLTSDGDAAAYAAAGVEVGLSAGAVRVAVHRLRRDFAAALRMEVAETLAEPAAAEVEAELRDLLAALAAESR